MYNFKIITMEVICSLFLLVSIPFCIIYAITWQAYDDIRFSKRFKKINKIITGENKMADCKGILILNDEEPEASVIMFDNKKQIFWTAIRLLYMLISRSNRIGNEIHILHMDTRTGVEFSESIEFEEDET
jgi:hypothetical protein